MSYNFLDAYGSVLTADSSLVSGSIQRPIVNIGSIIGNLSVTNAPASVSGVGLFNVNHTGNGSIITFQTVSNNTSVIARLTNSSVATLQGTNPWIIAFPTASIAGTYAEDTGHVAGERGLFTLGVRNDAVSSFTSANLDYNPIGVDSAGRTLTKPFAPEEARVYGVASTVNTGPSSLLAASGAGLRNYITDLWVANTGSVATLISFRDVDASVIGRTIAPAGGGSNIIHMGTPMRTHARNSQVEYTSATATSVLHVTAFGYIAP